MSVLDLLYQQNDDTIIDLPSGITASIKEMTGREQKLLTNRGQSITGASINQVLAACTMSIADTALSGLKKEEAEAVVSGLLSADRQCLLFHIRRISLSDDFIFKTKCPECGTMGEWEIKLSEQNFPIKAFEFQQDPTTNAPNKKFHTWDSKVRPGLKFKANFITGVEELKAARNKAKLHGLSDLEMRALQVWDSDKEAWVSMVPDRLGDKIIAEIRDVMLQVEGNQEDSVSVACPSCGQEVEFHLLGQPDFMIPSVLS